MPLAGPSSSTTTHKRRRGRILAWPSLRLLLALSPFMYASILRISTPTIDRNQFMSLSTDLTRSNPPGSDDKFCLNFDRMLLPSPLRFGTDSNQGRTNLSCVSQIPSRHADFHQPNRESLPSRQYESRIRLSAHAGAIHDDDASPRTNTIGFKRKRWSAAPTENRQCSNRHKYRSVNKSAGSCHASLCYCYHQRQWTHP